jgi:putative hydrolase of the HAD superfamily
MEKALVQVRNIIFDLGGVILNIDPQVTVEEMRKLGINDFHHIYNKLKQNEIFDQLEKGEISEEQFLDKIRQTVGIEIESDALTDSWNRLLLDFPPQRIELLQQLKRSERYNTFLLSNTNSIHKKAYTRELKEKFGIDGLESLFKKAYFSHEINMRKPDSEIFEYVLEDSNLKADETLFIDDSKDNIEAAQKLGIKTFLADEENTIIDLFGEQGARLI